MKKIILLSLFIVLGTTANAQTGVKQNEYIYTEYPDNKFYSEDGVLFMSRILVKYPQQNHSSTYTIPDGVITIAKGAFKGNKSINKIRIPSTIQYIGDNAFDDCSNLETIEIYESTSSTRSVEVSDSSFEAREVGRYNIQGVKVQEDEEGLLQIILYSDGTAKKVIK